MMRPSVSTKKIFGFTLIELLVTLSILAVMAALLAPFIQNYQYRSKTISAFNSLKIMQDSMGRYAQMNDNFEPTNWGGNNTNGGPWSYSATDQVTYCARVGDTYGNRIISDITSGGSNQVLRLTPTLQQNNYVLFYRTGPLTNMNFFPVFYYINNSAAYDTNKNDYVDRHGNRVNNTNHANFPNDGNYIISLFQ